MGSSRISRSDSRTSSAARATRRRSPPDIGPTGVVQAEVAHAEAVEDGADPGVAGPLVLGAHALGEPGGAEHDVAHGRLGGQGEGLRKGGDAQVTAVGDPAGVGFLDLGEHPQQGGLAGAVEADDADPGVVVEPERDVGEQLTGGAVALVDPVQIDDVGHDALLGYPGARASARGAVTARRGSTPAAFEPGGDAARRARRRRRGRHRSARSRRRGRRRAPAS